MGDLEAMAGINSAFDTSEIAPLERFDYWHAALDTGALPMEARATDARAFVGRGRRAEAESTFLSHVVASSHTVSRTKGGIGRRSDGTSMVMLLNHGSAALTQRAGTAVAFAGDVLVIDMDEPWELFHQTRCDITFLMLPGDPFRMGSTQSGPLILTARGSPLAGLLGNYIRGLPADADGLSVVADLAQDQVTALLLRGLAQQSAAPPSPPRLIDMIQSTIEAEISNPDLSAKLLCQRLGLSRTSLFDALASEKLTLGAAIRERRFAGCRSDVERAGATGATMSEIAERWGYRDLASFSRAFKSRSGMAPTRWAAAQ